MNTRFMDNDGVDRVDPALKKAELLNREGEYSREYHTLATLASPVTPSQATFRNLKAKHPLRKTELQVPENIPVDAIQLSQDQVRAALRSAPRASHPGPDGLRFKHLRQLALSTPDILPTLTMIINNLITGKGAPQWYYLMTSSGCMIALAKPGSTDVRPIAMGTTLRVASSFSSRPG